MDLYRLEKYLLNHKAQTFRRQAPMYIYIHNKTIQRKILTIFGKYKGAHLLKISNLRVSSTMPSSRLTLWLQRGARNHASAPRL